MSNSEGEIMNVTETMTRTLVVPGATLTYDVRSGGDTDDPVLFLVGSPMGAAGFGTLAGHFTDRTVVTYDPRGSERSEMFDLGRTTPDDHADDLHRLIEELGAGPVDLFASSGGAVNALALVAKHPEDVRMLIAHEPALATVLPDREAALAAVRAVHDTYQRYGWGAGMAHFMVIANHRGPMTDEFAHEPGPDPAMFGMPTEDDGTRSDVLLGSTMLSSTHYEPEFDALRAASTRIILAAGAGSEGILASRAARAVAERLGTQPVMFPGDHGGFFGGEYGYTGEPDAFAAKLRQVLEEE